MGQVASLVDYVFKPTSLSIEFTGGGGRGDLPHSRLISGASNFFNEKQPYSSDPL